MEKVVQQYDKNNITLVVTMPIHKILLRFLKRKLHFSFYKNKIYTDS